MQIAARAFVPTNPPPPLTPTRPRTTPHPTGIGGSGQDLRCKTRTLFKVTDNPDEL